MKTICEVIVFFISNSITSEVSSFDIRCSEEKKVLEAKN